MTLTDLQLIDILERNPNKKLIQFGCEQNRRARLHLYGVGMAEHLTLIKGMEQPFMHQLRTIYAQSNKDLFARTYKPISKVFTARGGATYYNVGPDLNHVAALHEGSVRKGMSCKKYVENVWTHHMIDDPMGMIFMEVDRNRNCYPTYKSCQDVFDYQLDGTGFEYIIFNISNEEKAALKLEAEDVFFRVVDDVADRIVKWKNKQIEVMDYFTNYFYDVPAMVCSDIPNPDGPGFISLYHYIFDLADQYLLKTSIKLTHDFLHAFPKYWEFGDECVGCKGTGKKDGQPHGECLGTGKKVMIRVSDIKILDYPTKEAPAPDVPGGYIEPSKTFHEIITHNLAELEEKISRTVWGSKQATKLNKGMGLSAAPNGTATATEVMDNRQPEIEALHAICDSAEARHKFIMDHRLEINMRMTGYSRRGGGSYNYGRRYLIEEPDALLERYEKARAEGLSPSILYGMYEQYLEAKYSSDGISLSLHKKLMKVEPFMHYTLSELKDNGATPQDIRRKQYYGEWLVAMDGDDLVLWPTEKLRSNFDSFVSTKPLPVKEEKPKPASAAA